MTQTRISSSTIVAFIVVVTCTFDLTSAHLARHGPRDRFWRHHLEHKSLIVDGVEYHSHLEQCLDSSLTEYEKNSIATENGMANRKVSQMYTDDYEGWVFLVSIENAIVPSHVKAIQTLASCVRRILPRSYESRSMSIEMGYDHDVGLGGNCPTHLAPLVEIFFPTVAADMQRTLELAYEAAGWAEFLPDEGQSLVPYDVLPDPKDVGFRATEHLTYNDFKEGLKDHTDGSDTKYTFNYAFSGPEDYGGGNYYIKYGHQKTLTLKPNKYDAMIFLGGYYAHGVTEITSGVREMFSNELWSFPDAPFGSNLWSNTSDRMRKYLQYCEEEIRNGNHGPCKVDFTKIELFYGEEEEEDYEEYEKEEEEDYEEEEELHENYSIPVATEQALYAPQENINVAPTYATSSSTYTPASEQAEDCHMSAQEGPPLSNVVS